MCAGLKSNKASHFHLDIIQPTCCCSFFGLPHTFRDRNRKPAMSVTATPSAARSFHSPPPAGGARRPRVAMTVRSFNTVVAAPILTKLRKDCATPLPVLRHMADAMAADMRAGLAADGGSDLKMILSYADALPTGYINVLYINN